MFNPKKRYTKEEIREQAERILKSDYFSTLLETIPNVLMIINEARQIIYVNKDIFALVKYLNDNPPDTSIIIGQRPGECFKCSRAKENKEGCGSTTYCSVCGFAHAIEESENGEQSTKECNIVLENGETITLNVMTKPFLFENEHYVFCAVQDISESKTKQSLERIFLHDILNTVSSLYAVKDISDDLTHEELLRLVLGQSEQLVDELQSYKLMVDAERNALKPEKEQVDLRTHVDEIITSLRVIDSFKYKTVSNNINNIRIFSDRTILRRIMLNLLKNAFEASDDHEEVAVDAGLDNRRSRVWITVKNTACMAEDVRLQVFQKTFSTKGDSRGWGTYSIKLLTEKYLQGKVVFSSNQEEGTLFHIELPAV